RRSRYAQAVLVDRAHQTAAGHATRGTGVGAGRSALRLGDRSALGGVRDRCLRAVLREGREVRRRRGTGRCTSVARGLVLIDLETEIRVVAVVAISTE